MLQRTDENKTVVPDVYDWHFNDDGNLNMVADAECVAQRQRQHVEFYKGEWFLDTETGVDWHGEIFNSPFAKEIADSIIKDTVMAVPGTVELIEFSSSLDRLSRGYHINKINISRMKRFNQNEITEKIKANPRSIRHILKNYDLSKYKNISQNNNEIAYLIVNNLENIPKCKCGYNLKFHKYSKGYAETCGKNECVNLLIKSKREQTCLQKYGTKSVFESDIFKNKIKQTNLEKYGVEHPSQTQEFQDKIKQTNLEKYGVEHVSQTDKWKDKVKQTKKSPPYSLKYFKNKINDDNIEILSEMDNNLKINCHNCNSNRSINKSTINFRIRNKQIICTKCNPIFKNQSNGELELYKFIKDNYNGIIIQNYKINGNEIDIYLPELKLGFEYNGVYYHSEKFLDKKKHYNKSMFFNEIDINLIHIWSDDWHNKKDIVKDIIKSKFNSTICSSLLGNELINSSFITRLSSIVLQVLLHRTKHRQLPHQWLQSSHFREGHWQERRCFPRQ